jgi:hypothetical protein
VLAIGNPALSATEAPRPLRAVTFNLLHGGPASGLLNDGEALEERLQLVTDAPGARA